MIRFSIAFALLVGTVVLPGFGAPDDELPPTTSPAAGGEDDMAAPTITGRNRLGDETSPYLLQHKNNPVHWWPWGPEAFAAARAADKPIFLSIGYSTCYWCHVMERESFETEDVAAIMNEHFVCIKVDREERPDVDDIYMSATQILNRGRGGWPMSVFLDPVSLKPFLAGTYYPPEDAPGRPGFKTLLREVADLWATRREAVLQQAEQVAGMVVEQHEIDQAPRPVSRATIDQAVTLLMDAYDPVNAGFGRGPNKFPTPVYLEFLLATAWEVPEVRKALLHTLDRMATGGMYDQIGGGFHRYSTDPQWIVPHFEKMLYDNGQLASAYAEAYERTGDPFYAHIVRETLDYVLREMRSDEGAFWSAQDAEVNHLEGENYLWVPDQVRTTLTDAGLADDVDFALEVFGFDRGSNFQDPHHPEAGKKNVVVLIDKPAVLADRMGMPPDAFDARVARIKAALRAERDTRDQPGLDDKVLAGWNGLMIRGFADGGRVLDEPRYVDAARDAARFVLERMRASDGGLLRTYRAGEAKIDAFLEDYAAMMLGLLALDRATDEPVWREAAAELEMLARARFWDEKHGGWFDTMPEQADLFVRIKSMYDGATPTGNSAMLNALLDLHERTGDAAYLDRTREAVTALSSHLASRPTASAMAMRGVVRLAAIDPDTLAAAEPAQGGVVKLKVDPKTVALGPGDGAWIQVVLDIEDGYHMNAHDPGLEMLIPLSVRLVGGEGLAVDPTYPDGEVYAGPVGAMRAHSGTVIIPIHVERTGDLTGREKLMLAYQVCDDAACLQPVSLVLPVTFSAK